MFLTEIQTALNSWPPKTKGHAEENIAIARLVEMGTTIGFGRLQQLAQTIGDFQMEQNPEKQKELLESLREKKRKQFESLNWEIPEELKK